MDATLTNDLGMTMVLLPAGSFAMGGDWDAEQADENELPRHVAAFDQPFYIGRSTVTQSQWQTVMGHNPSEFPGEDRPVENVSHDDALAFIARLNARENTRTYRLPTEAEWEYAARAGSPAAYGFGAAIRKLKDYAWYRANSGQATHPVGRLQPNAWGLFDMHGNVHEWCADWYARDYYAVSPARHPTGPARGVARVLRGGDWGSEDWYCRCAVRSLSSPQRRSPRVGFRLVKQAAEPGGQKKAGGFLWQVFARGGS